MKNNASYRNYPLLAAAMMLAAGIAAGHGACAVAGAKVWLCAMAACVPCAVMAKRHAVAQSLGILGAVFALGGFLACADEVRNAVRLPGGPVCYEAIVASEPAATPGSVQCDFIVTAGGRMLRIKGALGRDGRAEGLRPGDGIRARSVLRGVKDSGFWSEEYLRSHGYGGTTFVGCGDWRPAEVSADALPAAERARLAAVGMRARLVEGMRRAGLSGDELAVVAAMTLGERGLLGREARGRFAASGASHILAISGMHIGIVYAFLVLAFGRRRRAGRLLAVATVWGYVFVVGMPPSAVRAAVMLTVCSAAGMWGRRGGGLNSLAAAAMIILACRPMTLYDIGFRMSFMAVLAILLLAGRTGRVFGEIGNPVGRWCWRMTAVAVAAQVGVLPLVLHYFGRLSCYFLLANLLAVPVAAAVVGGTVVLAVTAPLPGVQGVVAKGLSVAAAGMARGVEAVAALPGASIEGVWITMPQVVAMYVGMVLAALIVRRAVKLGGGK